MNKGWQFAQTNELHGGNDGAIDTFAGNPVHSMVREIIQNSLDAHDKSKPNEPVIVSFKLYDIPKSEISELGSLHTRFQSCLEMAKRQKNLIQQDFFKEAICQIKKSKPVKVLSISDFNTTGLEGSTDLMEGTGEWLALIRGVGLTQKSQNSLGSFGHGSKAPFNVATLRTLFYLSKTLNKRKKIELRFQGKSILQGHKDKNSGFMCSATGYYGESDNTLPLIGENIPKWASDIRSSEGEGKGTSILIPYAGFDKSQFDEVLVSVICNFYYGIKLGKLNVIVDQKEINKHNLLENFELSKQLLEQKKLKKADLNYIETCFRTIETIENFDIKEECVTENFGKFDLFLRLQGDDLSRKVTVARETGMFITQSAPRLKQFPSAKPFDIFVMVPPGDGSDGLKRLENPQHDEFSFERVKNDDERRAIKKIYHEFVLQIKKVIEKYAALETKDSESLRLLSDVFYGVSGDSDTDSDARERGSSMYLSEYSSQPRKKSIKGKGSKFNVKSIDGEGNLPTGNGSKKGAGGDNPALGGHGQAEVVAPTGEKTSHSAKQVESLRVVRQKKNNSIQVFFNCYKEGDFSFTLFKVGETSDAKEVVDLVHDNSITPSLRIKIDGMSRQKLTLDVNNPDDLNFALEGWLNEVQA
jgi:hypothetical protein